jgi:hypothetical protein
MAMAKGNISRAPEDLKKYTEKIRKRTSKTLDEMGKLLKKEIKKNVGKEDGHDRNWLRRNDHPYSARNPHPPHKKPFVHKQSSELYNNVEITKGKRKDTLEVGVSPDKVPYIGAVLYGSTVMIGRNFLAHSLLNMNKKFKKMIKNIKKK